MPDENLGLVDCGDGDLEVIVGANAKVFRRIKKLIGEHDVKRFLVLWDDKSMKAMISNSKVTKKLLLTFPITRAINYLL